MEDLIAILRFFFSIIIIVEEIRLNCFREPSIQNKLDKNDNRITIRYSLETKYHNNKKPHCYS